MSPAVHTEDFLGLEFDTEHRTIRVDLTKPQMIKVVAYDARLNSKEYILKVTGRGLVLV